MTVSGLTFNNVQLQYQLLKPEADNSPQRQEIATLSAPPVTELPRQEQQQADNDSSNKEAFLTQLMEQMLANRIGLDKQKYDEIQQKIAEAQAEKDALAQQPQSPARDKQLAALDDKLMQLNKALEGLIEQANRNREQKERASHAVRVMAEQYRFAAYPPEEPKIFL